MHIDPAGVPGPAIGFLFRARRKRLADVMLADPHLP